MKNKVCVIGSINVDLTVTIPHFHLPGETILGTSFAMFPGGKGGNQAAASAKLGTPTMMVGKTGKDSNAEFYQKNFEKLGIDTFCVRKCDAPTGIALIEVEPASGENRIIVVAGANMKVDRDLIDSCWDKMLECEVFLFQLEIPIDTISYAAQKLHAAGKTVILDPAPAAKLPSELLASVDYLTPNETELQIISGCDTSNEDSIVSAARNLLNQGTGAVIAKMGSHGAMLITKESAVMVPSFKVNAVDSTGAGDSFNAGFATALTMGLKGTKAIQFANAVGGLSTQAMGAQNAMPTFEETQLFLKKNGIK